MANPTGYPSHGVPIVIQPRDRLGTGLRVRIRPDRKLTPKDVMKRPLHFPAVTSDTFEIVGEAMHSNFDTVSAGEFSQPASGKKSRRLKTSSFDILTVSWDPSWITYPGVDPQRVKKVLEAIIKRRCPVHLLAFVEPHIHGYTGAEWDALVTLRSVSRRLPHGEPDARYYTVEWSEYREPGVKKRRHGGGRDRKLPTTHKLRRDDTMRGLAKKFYGNGNLWRHIKRANGIKNWGSATPLVNMKRFKVGDRIKIPVRHQHHGDGNGHGNGGTPAPGRQAPEEMDDGLWIAGDV